MAAAKTEKKSGKSYRKCSNKYKADIGYLRYENDSNLLSIPIKIRERHFTEDTRDTEIEVFGETVFLKIDSKRSLIHIEIPIDELGFVEPFSARLRGRNHGMVAVGRISDLLDCHDDSIEVTVDVKEERDEEHYTDNNKLTFEDARAIVDSYIRKNSERRSRVTSRDVLRKSDVEQTKHNIFRVNEILESRLEVDRLRSSKSTMYKLEDDD